MRYPIWAFFFVLVLPPFTAHALLSGRAEMAPHADIRTAQIAPANVSYWTHVTADPARLRP